MGTQRDDAGALAPLFAQFQQTQGGGAVQAVQPHADALHPRLGRRLRQQAAAVQVDNLLIELGAALGAFLLPGLRRQVLQRKHVHGAVQIGVPLVVAAAGHNAVLQLGQAFGLNHIAEAVQNGTQRHIRVGGALPCPEGIGQQLVGHTLPTLQHQILHQRRGLAGGCQLRQRRLAVHQYLKIAQHSNFNRCHFVTFGILLLFQSITNFHSFVQ